MYGKTGILVSIFHILEKNGEIPENHHVLKTPKYALFMGKIRTFCRQITHYVKVGIGKKWREKHQNTHYK